MLFVILLSIQILIGIALVGLILVQRSEGGALGMGGGPSGFMSARGAGNFLTKATSILAFLFFANCIALTVVSNLDRRGTSVVDQVGADNVKLNEAQASAAAAAAAQNAQQSTGAASSSAAPSLTDLPSPTSAAPSLSTLGNPTPASSASSSSAARPAAKPAAQPAKPAASSAAASSASN
ncbi:preprotein translocase subunit SecG [Asticcacaulis sp.]|uniref:preprotein translocase subunit SecG n=1 Tax=Asticcacaulis sp. TaxID=1872648 RepID=UPI002621EFB9|nr:preprotein translocase subunit SecG [Asticcacaulis sp.]